MASHFMIKWESQLHKGTLELCVLNALSNGPAHGYDLAHLMRQHPGLAISAGTVYRVLRRLRDDRLVKASSVKSKLGPRRLCYTVTELGQRTRVRMNRLWRAMNEGVAAIEGGASA